MRTHGQKQPALGRIVPDDREFDIELIYGARRLAAARELGIDLLVEIRDIDDRSALIEMDIENRVREDISPYERGISYKRWLRSGLFATQAEIARALGISEAQVCRLLKYADLPAAVVAAFKHPHLIREEWASTLANLANDSSFRDGMLRRARTISASPRNPSPQEVFETLASDGTRDVVRTRARDEVVKGASGQALFRIGFRTKTVHLILPRDKLTSDMLRHVSEQLKTSLESVLPRAEAPAFRAAVPHVRGDRKTADELHARLAAMTNPRAYGKLNGGSSD